MNLSVLTRLFSRRDVIPVTATKLRGRKKNKIVRLFFDDKLWIAMLDFFSCKKRYHWRKKIKPFLVTFFLSRIEGFFNFGENNARRQCPFVCPHQSESTSTWGLSVAPLNIMFLFLRSWRPRRRPPGGCNIEPWASWRWPRPGPSATPV